MRVEDEERKRRSEAQRQEALKRKHELEKQRQAQVAEALKNIDKPSSKRKVFEDSDDDDEMVQSPSTSKGKSSNEPSSKKPKLFEDSGEDEDDGDDLKISNRHSGKNGEKLMHMEAKFKDSRFKLDDRFASDDENEEEEENEFASEKMKNRDVLSKVLGKEVKTQQKTVMVKESATKAPPRPFTRFDPDNEEHVKWQKEFGTKPAAVQESDESSDEDDENEDVPQENSANSSNQRKVEGHYFEMSQTFAEELREKSSGNNSNDQGFSFLAMIGRPADPKENVDEAPEVNEVAFKSMTTAAPSSSSVFELLPKTGSSSFFLTGEEPHVQSVVVNFKRTQSVQKMVGRWSTYRDAIMKIYHHHKKAAKKEMLKKTNGFVQKTSYAKKSNGN